MGEGCLLGSGWVGLPVLAVALIGVGCRAESRAASHALSESLVSSVSLAASSESAARLPTGEQAVPEADRMINCASQPSLRSLVDCIDAHAPPREWFEAGQVSFVVPSVDERRAWGEVVDRLLRLESSAGCARVGLPAELARYEVFAFSPAGGSGSCVLMEVADENGDGKVDRGWGTLIVNPDAKRELSIQVPHPQCDLGTRRQGIEVFEQTGARSFVMAGSHRHASLSCSPDQPLQCTAGEKIVPPPSGPVMTRYSESDAAHNVESFFQVATERMAAFYATPTTDGSNADFAAIQFHAKGASSCRDLDVFMSHGVAESQPSKSGKDRITLLSERLLAHNPTWKVGVAGSSRCALGGTENVQGRLLNGVNATQVATQPARAASGHFVHVEQKRGKFRRSAHWVRAINETWPIQDTAERRAK